MPSEEAPRTCSSRGIARFDALRGVGERACEEVRYDPDDQEPPSGNRVLIFGKIKPSKCRLRQEVTVYEAGSDAALGSDKLDGDGEYSVKIHPDSSLKVYAKVESAVIVSNYEHTHKCKGGKSEKIKISVG